MEDDSLFQTFREFVREHKVNLRREEEFYKRWSEGEINRLGALVATHADYICRLPGVIGISYGPTRRGGELATEAEIHVHVQPEAADSIRLDKDIPSDIGGHLVRLVPTVARLAGCSNMDNTRYATLEPGVNIGPSTGCGTLGVLVWYQTQSYESSIQNRYFLSSWHVLTNYGTLGPPTGVYQPGRNPERTDLIGFLYDAPRPLDVKGAFEVGVVAIDYRDPAYARFESPGYVMPNPPYNPYAGTPLYMVGAGDKTIDGVRSYLSFGWIYGYVGQVTVLTDDSTHLTLFNQVIIAPWLTTDKIVTAGDSGSVWVDESGTPIAITVGYWEEDGVRVAIASPLTVVFATLGLTNVRPSPPIQQPPTDCVVAHALGTTDDLYFETTVVAPLLHRGPLEPLYHDFRTGERHYRELYEAVHTSPEMRREFRHLARHLLHDYVRMLRDAAPEEKARTTIRPELIAGAENWIQEIQSRLGPAASEALNPVRSTIQSFAGKPLSEIERRIFGEEGEGGSGPLEDRG